MLPKSNRLPSFEIRSVMRRGKRISNAYVQCIFLPNQLHTPRSAFIVSTSVDKRATKRNRIKRLMREAVHRLLPQILGGIDTILIARSTPACRQARRETEISKSISELFRRIKLLP